MSRSREEWFEMAKVSNEDLNETGVFNERGGTIGGGSKPTEYRGVGTSSGVPTPTHRVERVGLDERFFALAEGGSAQMPPGVEHLPVTLLRDVEEPEPREYAVDGLVPFGAATSIYGAGGEGKSMLAMSLCTSLASESGYWLGRGLRPCPVLYVDFELTVDEQLRRVYSLCRGSGYEGIPNDLYYLCGVGKHKESAFWSAYAACAWYGIRLVVFDSWGMGMQRDSKEASEILDFFSAYIEPFLVQDIAVLIVDHQAKGSPYQEATAHGSVYKRNVVRSEIQIEAVGQDESSGTVDIALRQRKHNFGPLAAPFYSQLTFRDGEIRVNTVPIPEHRKVVEQGFPAEDRIMMALESTGKPMTSQDIADMIEETNTKVKSWLSRLSGRDKVREAGQQRGKPTYEPVMPSRGPVYYEDSR